MIVTPRWEPDARHVRLLHRWQIRALARWAAEDAAARADTEPLTPDA